LRHGRLRGQADAVRYLALGDSYTIGEGVAPEERWPVQLSRLLHAAGLDIAAPGIVARTGWTAAELAAALASDAPAGPFDLVSLLIGVNNQYRGLDIAGYRMEFESLLDAAVGLAGGEPGRVLILSIPDWGATPFATGRDRARIAAEIDAFNAVNREAALLRAALYVDVTGISRTHSRMLADDQLHPSGEMYALWAAAALPVALAALGTSPS
jgi:lysophospholipase L1-like esterase